MRNLSTSLATAIAVAACLSAATAPAAFAQTFGSTSPDNAVGPFGRDLSTPGTTGAVAETFQTPLGSPLLQSFTFFLGESFDGADLLVNANVFEFAVDHVVGPALYTSALRAGSSNVVDYDPITFSGVNLLLTPGTVYALVLRASAASLDGSTNFVGTTSTETFALGQLFTSTGSSDAELGAASAFVGSTSSTFGEDAALQVTFAPAPVTATPEPGSLALLATGVVGLGGFFRRRRSGAPRE